MQISFELTALSDANRYSNWIYSSVEPFLGNRILELGAGIGNMSQWLPRRELLVLTEADDFLYGKLKERFGNESKAGTSPGGALAFKKIDLSNNLHSQVANLNVDTIVSFNVMEHIQDDRSALREQIEVLRQSRATGPKRLVIFAPAHSFAFGSFDQVFQHYRRYEASGLSQLLHEIDPNMSVKTFYFNLLSLPGWVWEGRVRKSTTFKPGQIKLLEKVIPIWKPIDHFIHRVLRIPLGQSVVAVAEISATGTHS